MAEDRTADLESQLLQGARGVQNTTENMLERLAKMFTPTDLVTIKNILPEPFGWVYTDPKETQVIQPDSVTRRVEYGKPKVRTLEPEATKTIPGWEAYIALERMWKTYAQIDMSRIAVTLSSADEMDAFLNKAYQGTFDPDSVGGASKPADLGFEPQIPAANDRTTVAEAQVPAAPAPVVPTQDPALGFGDEDEQQSQVNQVPPLNDQEQTTTTPPAQTPGFGPVLPPQQ
jgi:hypothetical protein